MQKRAFRIVKTAFRIIKRCFRIISVTLKSWKLPLQGKEQGQELRRGQDLGQEP